MEYPLPTEDTQGAGETCPKSFGTSAPAPKVVLTPTRRAAGGKLESSSSDDDDDDDDDDGESPATARYAAVNKRLQASRRLSSFNSSTRKYDLNVVSRGRAEMQQETTVRDGSPSDDFAIELSSLSDSEDAAPLPLTGWNWAKETVKRLSGSFSSKPYVTALPSQVHFLMISYVISMS